MEALYRFRDSLKVSSKLGELCISEEIKHCIIIGQGRIFEERFTEQREYSMLVVH